MHISNLRRSSGDGSILAHFDLEVMPGVKLPNWAIKRGGRVFPPSPRHGTPAAILAPELMAEVTRLAMEGVGLASKRN